MIYATMTREVIARRRRCATLPRMGAIRPAGEVLREWRLGRWLSQQA